MSHETAIHRQVAAARAGTLPRVIARLASGWVVLGDPQVIRGYCLLLPDPVVPHLNALDQEGAGGSWTTWRGWATRCWR